MTDSTLPFHEQDWQRLARDVNAIDIACLTPATLNAHVLEESLQQWLNQGNAGALAYVDQRADMLTAPFAARPWARSALVIAFAPEIATASPLRALPPAVPDRPRALVAPYALQVDYHLTGQKLLEQLQQRIATLAPAETPQFEACTDTRPVMEKQLARLAGLGTRGYNSLIRNATHGCRLHLAVLFTSVPLPPRLLTPVPALPCSQCRQCLRLCPTGAFTADAFHVRRCRAWLASEYRRPLTQAQIRLLGNTLFGCGLCTTSCPGTAPAPEPFAVDAWTIAHMPTRQLNALIRHTILEHTGATLLKRNAIAAIANQTLPEQWPAAAETLANSTQSPNLLDTIRNAFTSEDITNSK